MESFHLDHVFDCSLAEFETAMDDLRLDNYVAKYLTSVKERTTLFREEKDGVLRRRIKCVPRAEIPRAAQALVKPEWVFWEEEIVWYRDQRRLEYRVLNNFFKEKFNSRGEYNWREENGKVLRHIYFELSIKYKVLIKEVGHHVERFIAPQVKKSLEEEAGILSRFLREARAGHVA